MDTEAEKLGVTNSPIFQKLARDHEVLHDIVKSVFRGKELMSLSLTFTMPWKLFCEMEENAPGCFFQRHTFRELMGRE